jgi:7-carboxy-7-deazaguanine synthase
MSVEEVLARVNELSSNSAPKQNGRSGNKPKLPLVELTGGEPLLQPEAVPLSQKLLDSGYQVMIETSGERQVSVLPREVIKIVDIKFVISSRRDYEFARDFTLRHNLASRVHQVIFSPVHADPAGAWQGMNAHELVEWILQDELPVRLGLQIHKFIWHPATRGV